MYTRLVELHVDPQRREDFNQTLAREVLPQIQRQSGFVDVIETYSENDPTCFRCMTFWDSKEEMERYDREVFPQLAQKLLPFTTAEPKLDALRVQTSSVHRIAAGKAA